jgi:hypothetical protein
MENWLVTSQELICHQQYGQHNLSSGTMPSNFLIKTPYEFLFSHAFHIQNGTGNYNSIQTTVRLTCDLVTCVTAHAVGCRVLATEVWVVIYGSGRSLFSQYFGKRIFKIILLMFHFVCHKERWATAPLDSHIHSEFHPTPSAIKQTSFVKDCVQTEGRKWDCWFHKFL